MEEKMVVKDVLVFDAEAFKENLVRNLITNNISYVQIENEFHFLDNIYRIYDVCELMYSVEVNSAPYVADSKIVSPVDISVPELLQNKNVSYTKKKIREDNRRANARFKGSVSAKVNNFRRF